MESEWERGDERGHLGPDVGGRVVARRRPPGASVRGRLAGRRTRRTAPDPGDFLRRRREARRPGARLALLRADLALRWEAGDRVGVEWYLRPVSPTWATRPCVALIYEEFCLREEDGEAPDPAEFLARFPEVAAPLRRVLDIHGLVGSASAPRAASVSISPAAAPGRRRFPEAGQTIAGFHLVEELGRGAFARVFLRRGAAARRPAGGAEGRAARARASRRPWPGSSTPTSSRSTPTGPTRRRGCTCSACPISAG